MMQICTPVNNYMQRNIRVEIGEAINFAPASVYLILLKEPILMLTFELFELNRINAYFCYLVF